MITITGFFAITAIANIRSMLQQRAMAGSIAGAESAAVILGAHLASAKAGKLALGAAYVASQAASKADTIVITVPTMRNETAVTFHFPGDGGRISAQLSGNESERVTLRNKPLDQDTVR